MKKINNSTVSAIRTLFYASLICFSAQTVRAQEDSTVAAAPASSESSSSVEPVKNTFENSVFINNQTIVTNNKHELGFLIQHRFGVIKDGYDFYGIYAPANIRLGLNYGITKKLTVGIGATKSRMQYDLEWKYKILSQQKGGGSPVSLVYYGDVARSEAPGSKFRNQDGKLVESNRLTFYHELMVARKFTGKFSAQLGINYAHHNIVDSQTTLTHDRIGVSLIARYKFSPQSSALIGFNNNIMSFDQNMKSLKNSKDPLKADFSIGYEVSTGSHQFQIFLCSADGILNQDVRFFNSNDFFKKQIIFGFNITRQWGL
ncbi:MAG: hypothetical protein IT247_08765 [Bacteroidia bacterium]|nr:hypothetical protein [Bacteroidia bacterium]